MDIYLLRHGIAESHAVTDAERDLTAEGRQKVREVMTVARRAVARPVVMVSSPYRRAMATAKIAAEVLDHSEPIQESRALVPEGDVRAVWDEIRLHSGGKSIMLVGHQPMFSSLGAYLLGMPDLNIDFKKGAVLAIEMPAFGPQPRGILKWMLTARLAA